MDDRQSEYERWVKPIEQQMVRAVWRIVRDPDEAADAFQEAMLTIWRRWPRVRRHANPPALMMTICIHAAYDRLRQRARHARREVSDEYLEHRCSSDPPADERLAKRETLAAIHAAIAGLPPMQGAAVSLRLLADLSFEAIGQALGCSTVTARTNCLRALRKLRGRFAREKPATPKEASS